MFSGIGGAYATLGIAEGLNNMPGIIQGVKDNKRRMAREDEELEIMRARRAEEAADRINQERIARKNETRGDARYERELLGNQRADEEYPEDRAFTEAQRTETLRGYGVNQRRDALDEANAPELARLGMQQARAQLQNAQLSARGAQQRLEVGDMGLKAARKQDAEMELIDSADKAFAKVATIQDPAKRNYKEIDKQWDSIDDGKRAETRYDPASRQIITDLIDEETGEVVERHAFGSLAEMQLAAVKRISQEVASQRLPPAPTGKVQLFTDERGLVFRVAPAGMVPEPDPNDPSKQLRAQPRSSGMVNPYAPGGVGAVPLGMSQAQQPGESAEDFIARNSGL